MEEGITIQKFDLGNGLRQHCVYDDLLSKIALEIQKIPNIEKYKLSRRITKVVCNILENAISSNANLKINKKQLCIDILDSIFKLSDQEKQIIDDDVEFLFENKMIKKLSNWKKLKNKIKPFFLNPHKVK